MDLTLFDKVNTVTPLVGLKFDYFGEVEPVRFHGPCNTMVNIGNKGVIEITVKIDRQQVLSGLVSMDDARHSMWLFGKEVVKLQETDRRIEGVNYKYYQHKDPELVIRCSDYIKF